MSIRKRPAVLTVDLEDYTRQMLRDHAGKDSIPFPHEVERGFQRLLEVFDACDARATFFCVGRLARELKHSVWQEISKKHTLGAHGYEHTPIYKMGPSIFESEALRAKNELENVSGLPVKSFRAPYFSVDGCHPWFGEILSRAGYRIDSSIRISNPQIGFSGTMNVPGGNESLTEVPLPCIGIGPKRITIIGGTYFRLFPLQLIRKLLQKSEDSGFIPMVYLHPYDIDVRAPKLPLSLRHFGLNAIDTLRRYGRQSVEAKLLALSEIYDFGTIESAIDVTHISLETTCGYSASQR